MTNIKMGGRVFDSLIVKEMIKEGSGGSGHSKEGGIRQGHVGKRTEREKKSLKCRAHGLWQQNELVDWTGQAPEQRSCVP